MKNQFAKLFSFPTGQLLIRVKLNVHSQETQIFCTTEADGRASERRYPFKTADQANEAFEAYDQVKADAEFTELQNFLAKKEEQ